MYEPAGQLLGLLCQLLKEDEFLTLATQTYDDTFSKVHCYKFCLSILSPVCFVSVQTHYVQLGAVVTLGHVTSAGVAQIHKKSGEEEPVLMETSQQGRLEEFVKKSLQRLGIRTLHV